MAWWRKIKHGIRELPISIVRTESKSIGAARSAFNPIPGNDRSSRQWRLRRERHEVSPIIENHYSVILVRRRFLEIEIVIRARRSDHVYVPWWHTLHRN